MSRVKYVELGTIVGAAILFIYIALNSWMMVSSFEAPAKEPDIVIEVRARQFAWEFIYPDGSRSATLRVKAGQTVELRLISEDVIHSFFIRDFGIKRDVVPGKINTIVFTPLEAGEYVIQCAEFCGQGHYSMIAKLVVE